MANKGGGKVLAMLLVIALPASVLSAETRGAMLFTSNTALLNGVAFQRTSAMFRGDKLSVPANSAVTITMTGSSILVPALSSITFEGDSVSLEPQAAVAVTTAKGMAARVKDIRISPAQNESGRFEVARYNGQVFVAARQGTVLIASAAGSRVLAEGGSATLADPDQQKKGGAIPPTGGIGATGSIPTWVAIAIGAGAAVIAGAIALATTGTPVTPGAP